MTSLLVSGGDLLTPFELIEDGALLVRDGRIERVGPRSELERETADQRVDAGGGLICPGFVDLQVNGGGGVMFTEEPSRDALERIARAHVRFGTTALLATVVTAQPERMVEGLAVVGEAVAGPPPGARLLGAHLEGPFIDPKRRGAHDERLIRPPDREAFERLRRAANGALRMITLAPELPGALDLIAAARAASVAVSIGHSDATFEEAEEAIDAGASFGTHVFNGMRGLAHRDPGVVGALLRDERAVAGVIADGVHVHPAVLHLIWRAKGADGVAIVTDAMPSIGLDVSSFRMRGAEIVVRDGGCYMKDGTLVGSALPMNSALRVMHQAAGVPLLDCVQMATATPARVLGLEGEIGVLRAGARADIVVCDRDLNVSQVYVGGALMYAAAAHGEGGAS